MLSYLRLFHLVHWLALTAWVSVLVAAAVAATGTFSILPHLDLTVDGYALTAPADHGRLAAGKVMDPIFSAVDLVQMIAAPLAILTLLIQFVAMKVPWRSAANITRTIVLVLAAGLLAGRAVLVTPEMNSNLRAFWSASEQGDTAAAEVHRQAFDAGHAVASPLYQATLLLLVIAVGATALATPPRPADRSAAPLPELLSRRS
jgi:hypothetical protein